MSLFVHNSKIWRSGLKNNEVKNELYDWMLIDSSSGKITLCGYVGQEPIIENVPQPLERVDMGGKWVFPGFHDSHIHIYWHGKYLSKSVNLCLPKSIKELQEKLHFLLLMPENPPLESNPWFVGYNWESDKMERYPTALDLDSIAPMRPIMLYHSSFHIVVVNSKALEIVGFDKGTKFEGGGDVDLYPKGHKLEGQPTGIIRELAVNKVVEKIPRSSQKIKNSIKSALRDCVECGITSVHCLDKDVWDEYVELARDDELPIHCFFAFFNTDMNEENRPKTSGESHGSMLSCRCMKVFIDGALGSDTAALSEPYVKKLSNGEENFGILYQSQEELNELVRTASERGFQLEMHVIGDRAAELALNSLEACDVPPSDRPIFVHCQLLNPSLIERMKKRGVIASIQPEAVIEDSSWIRERISKNLQKCMYPCKTLIDRGITCVGGSDSPVHYPNCLLGIHDAIFQPDGARGRGERSFQPSECVTFRQAVDMYTSEAVLTDFAEDFIGRLEPGYFANFVVLDTPLVQGQIIDLPSHPEALLETKAQQTWVKGVKLFEK